MKVEYLAWGVPDSFSFGATCICRQLKVTQEQNFYRTRTHKGLREAGASELQNVCDNSFFFYNSSDF